MLEVINNTVDLFLQAGGFVRNHLPLEQWPYITHAALAAMMMGLIMSLWGARLLRFVYVLGFMVSGAAVGVELSRAVQVDLLIGLVLGTGLAGLAGYLLYRCWVGLTTAAIAMLFVLLIIGPDVFPTEIQSFQDERLGVSTEEYSLPSATDQPGQVGSVKGYWGEVKSYLWDTKRDLVYRMLAVLSVAGLAGLGIGLILPRFTTIVGTSLLGVLGLVVGIGIFVSMHLPGVWTFIEAKSAWFLGAVVLYLMGALLFQARNQRITPAVAAPST
ncbi:MAG: hypothetical protein JSV03_12840 [Planctomycetota bacterium]|nr:MAG: hypothetical protein JSV03_12840 [Planctomycetota bacterium]